MTKFWPENYSFSTGNFPRSHGNSIVAYNFARFAAGDVKGRQVATGDGASRA